MCGGVGGGGSSGGCLPREGVKLSGQGGQITGSREEARAAGGPAARRLCLNPSLCRTQARGFITPAAAGADPSLSFLLSYLIFFFLSNTISGFFALSRFNRFLAPSLGPSTFCLGLYSSFSLFFSSPRWLTFLFQSPLAFYFYSPFIVPHCIISLCWFMVFSLRVRFASV